jgi:Holliday junction resolvase
MPNKNYIKGRNFENSVVGKFDRAGWPYVKRHYGSKGIADIVAVRKGYDLVSMDFYTELVFIQCKKEKTKKNHDEEKKGLIEYCKQMLAVPIWADKNWNNGRIVLTDLYTNKQFVP